MKFEIIRIATPSDIILSPHDMKRRMWYVILQAKNTSRVSETIYERDYKNLESF